MARRSMSVNHLRERCPSPLRVLVGLVLSSGLAVGSASGTTAGPGRGVEAAGGVEEGDDLEPAPDAAAALGALVPGIVVHGAGSWILGDPETARGLLIAEGAGLGLLLGGGTGIVLTGAARSVVGPLAAMSVLGAGLFGASFLLDVYHVSVPQRWRGRALESPAFESRLGVVWVHHPQFAFQHLLAHGVEFRPADWRVEVQGEHDVDHAYSSWLIEAGYRLWRAPTAARRDGSTLELASELSQRSFAVDDFRTQGIALKAIARVDTERVLPRLRGAFTEFEVGYAWRTTSLLAVGVRHEDDLLLARTTVGAYLPGSETTGGEVSFTYDHRHDGLAAGLLASGLGSGVLGHVGFDAHYYPWRALGFDVRGQVGSAWVLSFGVRCRIPEP